MFICCFLCFQHHEKFPDIKGVIKAVIRKMTDNCKPKKGGKVIHKR